MIDNSIKTNDNIEVYENKITMLCDDFIMGLGNPEDIKTNKRLISDMFRYVYKNYVCNILNNTHKNGNRYNIYTLNELFYITADIAHKYNSNMHILLFCCICNLSRSVINDWKNNINRELTSEESDMVKKWYQVCELDLVQGSSVFDIFLLKSNFMYNDSLQQIPVETQQKIGADVLPVLGMDNNDI